MNGATIQMDGTAYDRTIRMPIRLGDKIIVPATAMNAPHHQQMAEEFREATKALRTRDDIRKRTDVMQATSNQSLMTH